MIRSTFRNVMLALLVLCFGASFYIFRMTQDKQVEIADRQNDITRLNQELENAQTLNVALTELDGLTITEQTATQLDILRHLGLEQSDLEFQLESRDVKTIGNTSLYVHNVRISGNMAYETALGLCDRLQNTKKIMLDGVEITALQAQEGPNVNLIISGKIYGLDKIAPAVDPNAPPVTQPVPSTDASPTQVQVSASSVVSPAVPVSGTVAPVSASVVSGTVVPVSATAVSSTHLVSPSGPLPKTTPAEPKS